MSERSVRVLHVLVSRRIRGAAQVLLFGHPRWLDPRSGHSMMALPATKFAGPSDGSDQHVGERLESILHTDMGLTETTLPSWQRLGEAHARLVSLTHGVPSTYRIASVLARLSVASQGRAAHRLGGEWLTLPSALGRDDLSPTARAVLEPLRECAWLLPATAPDALLHKDSDHGLTARLLAAREGDQDEFWTLIDEIRPRLTASLRTCPSTRAISDRFHEVDDVLTDAAVRALEKLELFDPSRGTALMWLWTITRNTAISRLRRRRRTSRLPWEMANELVSGELDPGRLAAAHEEAADMQSRLDRALKDATPMIRTVWAMRMEEERSYQEISALLNLRIGTIATWIHRIREQAQLDRPAPPRARPSGSQGTGRPRTR